MPHDRFGRLIEVGDVVAAQLFPSPKPRACEVLAVTPGTDTCNVFLAGFDPRVSAQYFNAKDCTLLLKNSGSDPGPVMVAEPPAAL
jgi:hypothetical protein